MRPDRRAVLLGAAAALVGPAALAAPRRDLLLERAFGGDVLTLRSERRFAGAISSLRFRGVEYVDAADHGRLLQGAIHFDGWGECLNPTLAGASSDRRRTTSRLLAADVTPTQWSTRTRMAYWLRPGQTCTSQEGLPRKAANTRRLSDVVYSQTHRIGPMNPAIVDVAYTTLRPHASAVIEAMCLYMPPAFGALHGFDAAAGGLDPLLADVSEGERPCVLSTADGAHAFALFARTRDPTPRFGGFRLDGVSKLNVVFRPEGPLPAGEHRFALGWTIGTREEVRGALAAALRSPPASPVPPPG